MLYDTLRFLLLLLSGYVERFGVFCMQDFWERGWLSKQIANTKKSSRKGARYPQIGFSLNI